MVKRERMLIDLNNIFCKRIERDGSGSKPVYIISLLHLFFGPKMKKGKAH